MERDSGNKAAGSFHLSLKREKLTQSGTAPVDVQLFKKKKIKKKGGGTFFEKGRFWSRPLRRAALCRSARHVSGAPFPYHNWAMIRLRLFTEPDRYKCAAARWVEVRSIKVYFSFLFFFPWTIAISRGKTESWLQMRQTVINMWCSLDLATQSLTLSINPRPWLVLRKPSVPAA